MCILRPLHPGASGKPLLVRLLCLYRLSWAVDREAGAQLTIGSVLVTLILVYGLAFPVYTDLPFGAIIVVPARHASVSGFPIHCLSCLSIKVGMCRWLNTLSFHPGEPDVIAAELFGVEK
jgi:hypothetical protein